jgi:LacI family transcriptional regulator
MVALDFSGWHDVLSDLFFVEITRGVQEALEARGYGLVLNTTGDALLNMVKARAVDGVILITGGPANDQIPRAISSRGAACAVIGHYPIEGIRGVGSVLVGLRSGAEEVARFLVKMGHRHIGFIGVEYPDIVHACFSAELERLGVALREENILIPGRKPSDGERAMNYLLSQSERPTAVFARTDALAAGALRATRKAGVRVPEDISLVGHDDVPFAELTAPALTTVRVDCVELGKLAADTLISLLKHPDTPCETSVVQTRLIVRETVNEPVSLSFGITLPRRLTSPRKEKSNGAL